MTGADRLCAALLAHGVDTCFANPGTSEMHFVAALDRRPEMRCVLGLFEGVVTGAADGYGRMRDRPAATLLHLGPGLANGLANLHNARRAATPVINIVGEHSAEHLPLDAPLTSDIDSLAAPMSDWVRRMSSAEAIEADVRDAWSASMSKGVATLILPADIAWSQSAHGRDVRPSAPAAARAVDQDRIAYVADAMRRGRRVGFILSGRALRHDALAEAARLEAAGVRIFAQGANARIERGRGRAPIRRMSNQGEPGRRMLAGIDLLVLVDAREPVAFFGYPGQSGRLVEEDCEIFALAGRGDDTLFAIRELAERIGAATVAAEPQPSAPLPASEVDLTVEAVNRIVAQHLPEAAIVVDEAITSTGFYENSYQSAPHDYLQLTGGSIGIGIPLAAGAAVACPDRKVIALQADGSAMYTLQGLWTQARERLDVVTVIFANRSYAILHGEMRKMGIEKLGENARRMLDIDDPAIGWVDLARAMGVDAEQVSTAGRFEEVFRSALRRRGPFLIEAALS